MSVTDVCRLCSSDNNLVWVFHRKFGDSNMMKNLVYITTGVEIEKTDAISQKICEKCCHVTIKIYEFRKKSLINNRILKEKLDSLKTDEAKTEAEKKKYDTRVEPTLNATELIEAPHSHPHSYPHLKQPKICLRANEVEEYLKKQEWDIKSTTKPKQTARKKTFTSEISRSLIDSTGISKDSLPPIKLKITSKIIEEEPSVQKIKCHKKRKWTWFSDTSSSEDETPESDDQDVPRCKFCKTTFKSWKTTKDHMENNCRVKKNFSCNLPTILLTKIENNEEIVRKYHKAFGKPSPEAQIEVIEILSDDEDLPKTKRQRLDAINPEVTLKGEDLTEVIGPTFKELEALKNLFEKSKSTKMKEIDVDVQTDLPVFGQVQVKKQKESAVFEDLRWQLNLFRVPVEIKHGKFEVVFKECSPPKSKNLQLWDRSTAVDVKKTNKTKVAANATPIIPSKSQSFTLKDTRIATVATFTPSTLTTVNQSHQILTPKFYSVCPVPKNTNLVTPVVPNCAPTSIQSPSATVPSSIQPVSFKVSNLQKTVRVAANNVFDKVAIPSQPKIPQAVVLNKFVRSSNVNTVTYWPSTSVQSETSKNVCQSVNTNGTYWPGTTTTSSSVPTNFVVRSTTSNLTRIPDYFRRNPPCYTQQVVSTSQSSNTSIRSSLSDLHIPTSLVKSSGAKNNVTSSNQHQSVHIASVAPSTGTTMTSPKYGQIRVRNMGELT